MFLAATNATLTELAKALPAVYVFGGALLGGWIARSNQHKQWIWDNKAREYRELIDVCFVPVKRF